MLKKVTALMSTAVLVFSLSTLGFAQGAAKQDRVEGRVAYSDKDKSLFAVRSESAAEHVTTVHYDASTKWVSQYHGDKKVNTIDPSEVKDGDYVICLGSYNDKKEFQATRISKRLSHSPQ
jgi:hypothetical protein